MSNLKDVRTKVTKITLTDGVERELKFTLNAMAEMEDRYGSVDEAFKALESSSMKAIRFVLWCGFMHTDEGLTEQQVGNLIDINCMKNIMESVTDAFDADLPEAENDNALPNA